MEWPCILFLAQHESEHWNYVVTGNRKQKLCLSNCRHARTHAPPSPSTAPLSTSLTTRMVWTLLAPSISLLFTVEEQFAEFKELLSIFFCSFLFVLFFLLLFLFLRSFFLLFLFLLLLNVLALCLFPVYILIDSVVVVVLLLFNEFFFSSSLPLSRLPFSGP